MNEHLWPKSSVYTITNYGPGKPSRVIISKPNGEVVKDFWLPRADVEAGMIVLFHKLKASTS